MKEPLTNVGWACEHHSPRPRPDLFGKMPPESFLGRHVKLVFPTDPCPEGAPPEIREGWPKSESMWVLVTTYNDQAGEFHGTLANDPVFVYTAYCGMPLAFTQDEIAAVEGYPDPRLQ